MIGAEQRVDGVLRMRNEPHDVPGRVADAGDRVDRAVRVVEIAEHNLRRDRGRAAAFVAAVAVLDRPGRVADPAEQRVVNGKSLPLDASPARRGRRSEATRCGATRPEEDPPRKAPGSRCRSRARGRPPPRARAERGGGGREARDRAAAAGSRRGREASRQHDGVEVGQVAFFVPGPPHRLRVERGERPERVAVVLRPRIRDDADPRPGGCRQ